MYIASVIAVILTILFLRYFRKYLAWRSFFNKLPGEESFSYVFGNMHMYPGFDEKGLYYQGRLTQRYKYFFRLWFGPNRPILFLCHPDALRPIVKADYGTVPKPRGGVIFAETYDTGALWLGESILCTNGARWARNRRLLTPAFHFDILRGYMEVFNDCANILKDNFANSSKNDKSFNLMELIDLAVLDALLRCICSNYTDCQRKGKNEYTKAIAQLQTEWKERGYNPLLFMNLIFYLSSTGRRFFKNVKYANKVGDEIIAKRKNELETEEVSKKVMAKKNKDFLDILLLARDEDGVGLTPVEIRNELDTFLFAGHDTTTSSISWALYSMAKHPEHQQKVYEEILEVMGNREEVTLVDLPKLQYTTMCIKESIRHNSTVPATARKLGVDMEICGHIIPKGSEVFIDYWDLHHNPHIWEDPMTYKPERFHPDLTKDWDPLQFMPFSAGERNCIGQNFAMNEMKALFINVIRKFQLRADPDRPGKWLQTATMVSEDGLWIYATPRDQKLANKSLQTVGNGDHNVANGV